MEEKKGKYEDILHLPRPLSRRGGMSSYDRAAQFSPFAALTGYDDAIAESARLTDERIEPGEEEKLLLDRRLLLLRQMLAQEPEVTVTWFVSDEYKAGGRYVSLRGRAKRLDELTGALVLTDGSRIPLADMICLEITRETEEI